MTTRIYRVETNVTHAEIHLIEATSQAAAWRALAEQAVQEPTIASGKEIATLMAQGVKVKTA